MHRAAFRPERSERGIVVTVQFIVFVVASLMVLTGALGVLIRKNPVHAALSLVLTLFGVAVHFVALEAHFLAAVQVIVYAGAIVVLFLFVIMLLGVDRAEDLSVEPFAKQRIAAPLIGVALAGFVGTAVIASRAILKPAQVDLADAEQNITEIGRSMFSDYVFAFELTSVLLVIAVVGTVLLARRQSGAKLEAAK
jgi:NADH-quinone oxidoreductase subunit J